MATNQLQSGWTHFRVDIINVGKFAYLTLSFGNDLIVIPFSATYHIFLSSEVAHF
jgi:hypothetical protein